MIAALLLVSSPMAHISMNPNYGAASGGYFMATMKIPHGERGMHSTKFVLHVPRGVATVRPEVPMGWSVDMQMYDLPEDQWFVSHGNTVKTAPDTITWTADSFATALDDAHLMNIGLQTKLLCKFNDPVGDDYSGSNSIYQGQYTLWWKVEQHSAVIDDCDADGKNCVTSKSSMWTGALKDNEDGSSPGWNPPAESGVKACPFLFIYAGDGARCTDGDGDPTQPGMSWMGKQVEPTPNQAEVKHEQHVIELATEAALASHESLEPVRLERQARRHHHHDRVACVVDRDPRGPHQHVRDARQQPPLDRGRRGRARRRLDRHPPLPLLLPRRQQEGVRAVGRGRAAPQHDPDQVRHPDARRHRRRRRVSEHATPRACQPDEAPPPLPPCLFHYVPRPDGWSYKTPVFRYVISVTVNIVLYARSRAPPIARLSRPPVLTRWLWCIVHTSTGS